MFSVLRIILFLGFAQASPDIASDADRQVTIAGNSFGEYGRPGHNFGKFKAASRTKSSQKMARSSGPMALRTSKPRPIHKNHGGDELKDQEHIAYSDGSKIVDAVIWLSTTLSFTVGMTGVLLIMFGVIGADAANGMIGLSISLFMMGWLLTAAFRRNWS